MAIWEAVAWVFKHVLDGNENSTRTPCRLTHPFCFSMLVGPGHVFLHDFVLSHKPVWTRLQIMKILLTWFLTENICLQLFFRGFPYTIHLLSQAPMRFYTLKFMFVFCNIMPSVHALYEDSFHAKTAGTL